MPINITQVKGRLLKAEWEGHEVLSGKETKDGPYVAIPYGLFLGVSIGLCSTVVAIRRIEEEGFKAENVKATVDSKFDKKMSFATDFTVNIEIESDLPKELLQKITDDAANCFVQKTIRNQPTMNVSIKLKE
jgi:uncharacterized OsmC-like protein